MADERRKWSLITPERFAAYTREAANVLERVREMHVHPFSAALAGVALIKAAVNTMGGDVEWWCQLIAGAGEIEVIDPNGAFPTKPPPDGKAH